MATLRNVLLMGAAGWCAMSLWLIVLLIAARQLAPGLFEG